MLIDIVEENGEIKFRPGKAGNCIPVEQHLIDKVIEESALEEVYTDVEEQQLAEAYEVYLGNETQIISEVALLFNAFVQNLRFAGYEITRKGV